MLIHYASDLHLEFYKTIEAFKLLFSSGAQPITNNKSNVLVLAGDIGNPFHSNFSEFINHCCNEYGNVVYVAGNHEYYQKNAKNPFKETDEQIVKITKHLSNFHMLNNSKVIIEDITFIGCPLFTYFPESKYAEAMECMNDFNYYKPQDVVEKNKASTAYLSNYLDNATNEKIVVVTHHLPSYNAIHAKYKWDLYNYLFANALDSLVRKDSIVAWICGHTHKGGSYGKIHINPFGYPGEGNKKEIRTLEL